ncbi:MliC family protein [Vibrio minamisatsumaniensis]|uniref:MliC family protein n=1 Tax=Vibrio minamisatsumaniensis TaxID=2910243 RepID=UPI003D1B5109
MKTLLLASLGTVALVGCSNSAAPDNAVSDNQVVTYQCEADVSYEVTYLDNEKAVLSLFDNEYHLIQVPAGSGTKYILDDDTSKEAEGRNVTLRTKGDHARLVVDRNVYKNCRQ